jgi:hypothetical protein
MFACMYIIACVRVLLYIIPSIYKMGTLPPRSPCSRPARISAFCSLVCVIERRHLSHAKSHFQRSAPASPLLLALPFPSSCTREECAGRVGSAMNARHLFTGAPICDMLSSSEAVRCRNDFKNSSLLDGLELNSDMSRDRSELYCRRGPLATGSKRVRESYSCAVIACCPPPPWPTPPSC